MATTCLRRPHYGTASIHRKCFDDAQEARVEVKEDMLTYVSKAVESRNKTVLRRRFRRLQKIACQPS